MTSGDSETPPTPAPPDPHVRADKARDVFSSTRRRIISLRRSIEAQQKLLASIW
jgi:hypothetical protein